MCEEPGASTTPSPTRNCLQLSLGLQGVDQPPGQTSGCLLSLLGEFVFMLLRVGKKKGANMGPLFVGEKIPWWGPAAHRMSRGAGLPATLANGTGTLRELVYSRKGAGFGPTASGLPLWLPRPAAAPRDGDQGKVTPASSPGRHRTCLKIQSRPAFLQVNTGKCPDK